MVSGLLGPQPAAKILISQNDASYKCLLLPGYPTASVNHYFKQSNINGGAFTIFSIASYGMWSVKPGRSPTRMILLGKPKSVHSPSFSKVNKVFVSSQLGFYCRHGRDSCKIQHRSLYIWSLLVAHLPSYGMWIPFEEEKTLNIQGIHKGNDGRPSLLVLIMEGVTKCSMDKRIAGRGKDMSLLHIILNVRIWLCIFTSSIIPSSHVTTIHPWCRRDEVAIYDESNRAQGNGYISGRIKVTPSHSSISYHVLVSQTWINTLALLQLSSSKRSRLPSRTFQYTIIEIAYLNNSRPCFPCP